MSRQKILTLRKGYEGPIFDSPNQGPPDDWDPTDDLAQAFLRDKEKLDIMFQEVNHSDLPRELKIEQINALQEAARSLQEEYCQKVVQRQKVLQEHGWEAVEQMRAQAEELRRQADSLRGVRMEAASVDASAAADAADAQKKAVDQARQEYSEKLNRYAELAKRQRERIMRDNMENR